MKPLHLEKVQIETAARGGGSGEIVLTLVPIAVGQEIEARHQAARAANQTANIEVPVAQEMPTTPAVRATTYQLPMDELMLFGITSLGFVPLLLLLIAVGSRVSDFFSGASRLGFPVGYPVTGSGSHRRRAPRAGGRDHNRVRTHLDPLLGLYAQF